MSIFEVVLVATAVNLAASFIVESLSPRLRKLRETKPALANAIGPLLLIVTAGSIIAAEKLKDVSFTPHIPVFPVNVPGADWSFSPSISIWWALLLSTGVIFISVSDTLLVENVAARRTFRAEDAAPEMAYLRSLMLQRPAQLAFGVCFALGSYKMIDRLSGDEPTNAPQLVMMIALIAQFIAQSITSRAVEGRSSRVQILSSSTLAWVAVTLSFWV